MRKFEPRRMTGLDWSPSPELENWVIRMAPVNGKSRLIRWCVQYVKDNKILENSKIDPLQHPAKNGS